MKAASTFLTVLAILGALAAGALWYFIKGQKETLTVERDALRIEKSDLEQTRDNLTGQVNDLTGRNAALSNELGDVKTRNTTLETRVNQLNRDLAQARANAESAQADARRATEEASGLRRQVIELTANLDGARAGQENLEATIKDLQQRLGASGIAATGPASGEEEKTPYIATSVATVGPKSSFVVLNAGGNEGFRKAMRVGVSRDGELIAQGLITEVLENLAIAQVIPNTLTKAPQVGDEVFTVN